MKASRGLSILTLVGISTRAAAACFAPDIKIYTPDNLKLESPKRGDQISAWHSGNKRDISICCFAPAGCAEIFTLRQHRRESLFQHTNFSSPNSLWLCANVFRRGAQLVLVSCGILRAERNKLLLAL
jgi:hypothetical protein